MKAFIALFFSLLPTGLAWSVRQIKQAGSIAALSAIVATTSPAMAATDFVGSYTDPKHPNCQRIIEPSSVSGQVVVRGTDGTPGCPADGSGNPWELFGRVTGNDILVDFTPKGGPKDLKGVGTDSGSIAWPDGNQWTRLVAEKQ